MEKNKKKDKTKMLFITFMGLAAIAVGVKLGRVIKEKMNKKNGNDYR